jgi:hypothetical protein
VATGEGVEATEQGGSAMRSEKPVIVYIAADDATDSATRKLEEVVFKSEQLAVGAKFFVTLKMSSGDALQDRILKDAGKGEPRLVFLTRDYGVHTVLDSKAMSAGRITKAMEALVRETYENSFDGMVKEYIKLLNEMDRVEGRKSTLADQKARLAEKPNAGKAKKLEREEQEIQAEADRLTAREKELLTFKAKGETPNPKA